MATIIKVKNSNDHNDNILINLDSVTLIKKYRGGTRFYFGKEDFWYVSESYKKVNEIIQGIYE